MIDRCTLADPRQRPTAKQIVQLLERSGEGTPQKAQARPLRSASNHSLGSAPCAPHNLQARCSQHAWPALAEAPPGPSQTLPTPLGCRRHAALCCALPAWQPGATSCPSRQARGRRQPGPLSQRVADVPFHCRRLVTFRPAAQADEPPPPPRAQVSFLVPNSSEEGDDSGDGQQHLLSNDAEELEEAAERAATQRPPPAPPQATLRLEDLPPLDEEDTLFK